MNCAKQDDSSRKKNSPFRYCPGCGHRVMHKLLIECIDELAIRDRIIGIAPVGCAVFAYDYFNFDMLEVPHGRPPAAATAIKRVRPDNIVFTYQGDGDLAAIGLSEIMHTAMRGENICVFFVNNATYGMTGGQMAPTTLIGQKTSTTKDGRSEGFPLRVAEMLGNSLEGPCYVARAILEGADNIATAKQYILKALSNQVEGKGFSFVEVLSSCPTDWHMSPSEAARWMGGPMLKQYPTGVLRDCP